MGLCSVWVAINAAIERTRVVHAGPRHGWAVATLGGVGGGRVVACGRVVGVVAASAMAAARMAEYPTAMALKVLMAMTLSLSMTLSQLIPELT